MRGEHNKRFIVGVDNKGIIPACAGSTDECEVEEDYYEGSSPHARGARNGRSSWSCPSGDHPRMRGEHVRGGAARTPRHGIIPACAGSTTPVCAMIASTAGSSPHARGALKPVVTLMAAWRDHPRMRGEHGAPHERLGLLAGIIPACAGSTLQNVWWYRACIGSSPHARGALRITTGISCKVKDHPRMRGEHKECCY